MMVGMWLLSIKLRNVSIVDIGWGLGFVLVMGVTHGVSLMHGEWNCERLILPIVIGIWGLRLSGYIAWRNVGHGEDYRYREMRERNGSRFVWSSLWRVFGLQGAVMWIVSLPIQTPLAWPAQTEPSGIIVGIGMVVWGIGQFFEAVGDYQLARFKSRPENKGRVMNRGLWRYTRHPNYFGDFMVWWGVWIISMSLSDWRSTWWSILSPALMSFLIVWVSGVALLEKSLKSRSPEYLDYIQRTSAFFPRPPKK